MFDIEKTYWNRQGAAQAKYEEMQAAGWEYNKVTRNHMHRYYRYHNDGDAPARIRYLKRILGYYGSKNNSEILAYEARLEEQATERIEIEYRRFQRAQLSNQPAR